jgi:intraflagellar transport protein 46
MPDYMPAVGDIDAFIKLPRPDGKVDNLGITVLDEPALDMSDAAALEIQLRHASKKLDLGEAEVHTIENAENNSKAIKAWMASIDEVHKKKPPPEVTYSKPMPDIESLMQVWPPQFEDELNRCRLPSKDLDVSLEDYVRIVCALFDIPVHGSLTESLHVLFTLYSEFKNNDHFRNEMDAATGFSPMNSMVMGDNSMMMAPAQFGDTMGGIAGDPHLIVDGSMLSPVMPQGVYDHEVAEMGDEINPPPVTFHER